MKEQKKDQSKLSTEGTSSGCVSLPYAKYKQVNGREPSQIMSRGISEHRDEVKTQKDSKRENSHIPRVANGSCSGPFHGSVWELEETDLLPFKQDEKFFPNLKLLTYLSYQLCEPKVRIPSDMQKGGCYLSRFFLRNFRRLHFTNTRE